MSRSFLAPPPALLAVGIDRLDRLESASGPWGSSAFVVNALGDRTSSTVAGATTTYSCNGTTGRLAALSVAQTDSFSYDNNGNLLTGGGVTFTYTLRNMVRTATGGGVSTTTTTTATTSER